MRKIVNYISLLLLLLLLPIVTNAASANVGIECPSSAVSGETISCSIKMNTDVSVNGLVLNYTFSGGSFVSFTPAAGFTSNYTSATGFNIGNSTGKSGSYTIGTLKVKVNSATTVTLKNIDISDVNFNSYSSANRSASIRLKSTNNSLASLSLVGGTLSPAFNTNVTSYTSTINSSSVTINATKGDNYQTISGTGNKTLKYGTNTFKVVVKSEAGSSKTYTIVITRPDSRDKDNNLNSLSVDKGSISFNKDVVSYNVKVAKDVSSIKVNATLSSNKAKFVSGFGPRNVNLNYGVNNVLVKVQAENETIKTYTIKVTREDDRSSNNSLSSISLSSGNINFSKDVTNYNVSVPFEVTKIDVTAVAEDSKSKVNVVSPNLIVGNNTIIVTVTAENGQSKEYKIIVKRLAEQAELSDNNNISSIDIKGYGIEFNPETNEYDINIGDDYALVIDVLLEDPNAKYVIEGNEDLKDGSVITITSTSESGEVKEYKLNVKKQIIAVPVNNRKGNLMFGLIGFVLGLITMFVTLKLINRTGSKKVAVATAGTAPTVKVSAPSVQPTATVTKSEVAPAPKSAPAPAPVAPAPKPAPAPAPAAPAPKPVPAPATTTPASSAPATPSPAPATAAPVAQKPVTAPAAAPAPAAKPVMTEANVAQPVSKTANVIPENKTQ